MKAKRLLISLSNASKPESPEWRVFLGRDQRGDGLVARTPHNIANDYIRILTHYARLVSLRWLIQYHRSRGSVLPYRLAIDCTHSNGVYVLLLSPPSRSMEGFFMKQK